MVGALKRLQANAKKSREINEKLLISGANLIPYYETNYTKNDILNNWTAREVMIWTNRHLDAKGRYYKDGVPLNA